MKILIAAYIKGNPYKLLNSVDSEGKFLIFANLKMFLLLNLMWEFT